MDRPSTIAELVDENEELRQANARLGEELEALRKQNRQVMLTNMNYLTERDKAKEELAEARTVRPEAREAIKDLTEFAYHGRPYYLNSGVVYDYTSALADLATVRRELGMEADHA